MRGRVIWRAEVRSSEDGVEEEEGDEEENREVDEREEEEEEEEGGESGYPRYARYSRVCLWLRRVVILDTVNRRKSQDFQKDRSRGIYLHCASHPCSVTLPFSSTSVVSGKRWLSHGFPGEVLNSCSSSSWFRAPSLSYVPVSDPKAR